MGAELSGGGGLDLYKCREGRCVKSFRLGHFFSMFLIAIFYQRGGGAKKFGLFLILGENKGTRKNLSQIKRFTRVIRNSGDHCPYLINTEASLRQNICAVFLSLASCSILARTTLCPI